MKTKEKILVTALNLYNNHGYNNITTRHIAKELNISSGNLHYHYKHTEEIIKSIFFELKAQIDSVMNELKKNDERNLDVLHTFTLSMFKTFYSYRFIFLNFLDIVRAIPEIESEHKRLIQIRRKEFETIFSEFQTRKVFIDNLPAFVLDNLINNMFINFDNWVNYNELTLKLKDAEAINYYSQVFLSLFYPILNYSEQEMYRNRFDM